MVFDLYANALYNFSVIEVILRVVLLICLIVLAVKEIRKTDRKKSDDNEWEHVYGEDE